MEVHAGNSMPRAFLNRPEQTALISAVQRPQRVNSLFISAGVLGWAALQTEDYPNQAKS